MLGTDLPRQLYQIGGAPGAECRVLPPATGLAGSVHYYWTLDIVAERVVLPVIPDNALDLVLSPTLADFAELYFPVDEPFEIALEGPVRYVGVCLGLERAARLLGHETETLGRLGAGAETVAALGLGPLIERLREASGTAETVAALDDFLHERAGTGAEPGSAAAPAAFGCLLEALDAGRVAETARRLGISERQLRRESRRLFGLAPKKLQRVTRLQRAIGELVEGLPPTDDYHDDAHRIREIRALTGWTPGEIRRLAEIYNTADTARPIIAPHEPTDGDPR